MDGVKDLPAVSDVGHQRPRGTPAVSAREALKLPAPRALVITPATHLRDHMIAANSACPSDITPTNAHNPTPMRLVVYAPRG